MGVWGPWVWGVGLLRARDPGRVTTPEAPPAGNKALLGVWMESDTQQKQVSDVDEHSAQPTSHSSLAMLV